MLLDAHADTWDQYYGERYFHGTPFRRALEEGLIAPERSTLAGMRGPLYAPSDLDEPRGWGFEILPCDELRATRRPPTTGAASASAPGDGAALPLVRHRRDRPGVRAGDGNARGRRAAAARGARVPARARGPRFVGFDVVEVAPAYDGPGQQTALLAASIAYELLALRAVAHGARIGAHERPAARPAPSARRADGRVDRAPGPFLLRAHAALRRCLHGPHRQASRRG